MIKGFYRLRNEREVRGWAFDSDQPVVPVYVEILHAGQAIGSVVADQLRNDLVNLEGSNGFCGFSFKAAEDVRLESKNTQVRVKNSLDGGHIYLNPASTEERKSSEESGTSPNPVFIVGSPRSGTSAFVDVITASGYSGFREGNYLPIFYGISRLMDAHFSAFGTTNPKTMMHHIDGDALKKKVLQDIVEPVVDLNTNTLWFDKTGGDRMIRILPHLLEIWPNCRIVFLKRRGIENIISRTKKFPDQSFEFHCKGWAETMCAWRETKPILPREKLLEIDQRQMIIQSEQVAATLATFLNRNEEKKAAMLHKMRTKRAQESEVGSAERISSLQGAGWSEEQQVLFNRLCRAEMDAFGYSTDEHYWLSGRENA